MSTLPLQKLILEQSLHKFQNIIYIQSPLLATLRRANSSRPREIGGER